MLKVVSSGKNTGSNAQGFKKKIPLELWFTHSVDERSTEGRDPKGLSHPSLKPQHSWGDAGAICF